jgi:hypothetical protein
MAVFRDEYGLVLNDIIICQVAAVNSEGEGEKSDENTLGPI